VTDSSNAVANTAIQIIGDNTPPVTGQSPSFDNSPAGVALQRLYPSVVTTIARQFGWDLARNTVALTPSGNTPVTGYLYEFLYPSNGIEIWQLVPPTIADPNNPLPVNWNVCNTQVGGIQTKVIQTNLAAALAVYNNNPTESTWDPLFRESVVRLLASELAMALFGRPDSSQALIEQGGAFESIAEGRPD
jgi:hypothetical protein